MWSDQFHLKKTENYRSLFWEIYKQEKSLKNEDKIAVQIRKEELLKENAIALIKAYDIRQDLQVRIDNLKEKIENDRLGYNYGHRISEINKQSFVKKMSGSLNMFQPKEEQTLALLTLQANLQKTDMQLVRDEIKKIRNQVKKTNQEYLIDAENTRKARFNKWGAFSYRSVGFTVGAVFGGIMGTLLVPGIGSGIGVIIGGSIGGVFGSIFFGLLVNSLIVDQFIPLSKAFKQASAIKTLRIEKRLQKQGKKTQASFTEENTHKGSFEEMMQPLALLSTDKIRQTVIALRKECPKSFSRDEIKEFLNVAYNPFLLPRQVKKDILENIEITLIEQDALEFVKQHHHTQGFTAEEIRKMFKDTMQLDRGLPQQKKDIVLAIYENTLANHNPKKQVLSPKLQRKANLSQGGAAASCFLKSSLTVVGAKV